MKHAKLHGIAKWSLALLIAIPLSGSTVEALTDKNGGIYETLEWSIPGVPHSGNPFDIDATVTFSHAASGEKRVTRMFYDENNTWKFRFTGTRTGTWTFSSSSRIGALSGKSGTVIVTADPGAHGFMRTRGNQFVIPVGSEDNLKSFPFHVYMDESRHRSTGVYGDQLADWLPNVEAKTRSYCQDAKNAGFRVIFINPHVQLFKLGVVASRNLPDGADSPDPATFRIMERIIATAHEEGIHLHIWIWGDEDRGWTPVGVGGINGTPDKRLQRYIAARLGPLPGWSMGYGFDLHEWVQPAQVSEWSDYLHRHWGWKHLLEARQESYFKTPSSMDIFATDERFSSDWYKQAVAGLIASGNRPILFNRRWIYTRDGYGMDQVRRAMWQFTMAGAAGVAGWFGPHWTKNDKSFSHPEQLHAYHAFWHTRLLLDMERDNERNKSGGTSHCLRDKARTRFVFYSEDASSMKIDLSGIAGTVPVVLVNCRKAYSEELKGRLGAGEHTISLGEISDWAIAAGDFGEEPITRNPAE